MTGPRASQGAIKHVNLALQGGGAHGAFTWGVVDQLLEDGRIAIEGISGASAGAMNAVLIADGLASGGAAGAREKLADFWRAVSIDGKFASAGREVMQRLFAAVPFDNGPLQAWASAWQQFFSPYDLNPFDINPLRDILRHHVDFETIRARSRMPLFVSATNVLTGKLTIFARERLSVEAVMASACLPTLFKAVEIDGTPYWDGGYMGNPALFPLYKATETEDIILVQINPVTRAEQPRTPQGITNRTNEITFNSSLQSELRAAEFVARLVEQGKLPRGRGPGQYRHVKIHRIALGDIRADLGADTKTDTAFGFLESLRDAGRMAAKAFLVAHFDNLGVCGTLDLRAEIAAEWA